MTHSSPGNPSPTLDSEATAAAAPDDEILRAQEQLLQLRQQQEALERQKRELEALGQRQAGFETAREEASQQLSRALVALEREQYEADRQVVHLRACREKLERQATMLESLDPARWAKADLPRELTRAEAAVQEAEAELGRTRARVNAEQGREVLAPAPSPSGGLPVERLGFGYWLKAGLAFTLPLILALAAAFGTFLYLLLAAKP